MALSLVERAIFGALILLIFLSQLSALLGLLRKPRGTDRGSAWALVSGWYTVLIASLVEAFRFADLWREPHAVPYVGAGLFALGLWLRVRAVTTLKEYFSPLVELQGEHQLITRGIYARMRHPAYLGSLLWSFSVPLMLGSVAGLIAALAVYFPALSYRIRVEEALLGAHFGEAWTHYRERVPALFPGPRRPTDA